MKADWKNILVNNGAEFDDSERVIKYGDSHRETSMALNGNIFADLSHFGLISIRGEDAETFLQGQLTNDIKAVNETTSQLSAYCNPKGRMLASFLIFKHADTFYLRMPAELIETTGKRLQMYILRSQVTLEDASDAWVRLGVSGPDAVSELSEALNTDDFPSKPFQVTRPQDILVIRLPGQHPRFELYASLEHSKKLFTSLNVRCAPVGADAWALLDILAGIPSVYAETVDAFIPQMTNLQLIGGVSFQKGCYTGQEIVARMQYLGKLKRRMYLLRLRDGECPEPGTDLFTPSDEQSAGKIVDARPHPDGGCAALAVIKIDAADKGKLFIGETDGSELELQDLPYAFEVPED